MQVAVAVVSWNTRELLRECLRSLQPDAEAGRAEVWVIDNASEDDSAAMVSADFPWVRLISSDENLGFGAAVNVVAAQTGTEPRPAWIAAANADIVLHPGALERLLAAGESDLRAAIIAPALVLPDGSTQHSVHPFPGLRTAVLFNTGIAALIPGLAQRLTLDGHWDQTRGRTVDWAHGAFLLIRRSAFDQVDGFDADQFLYAEDLDIAWRTRRVGWHTRYEPAARVDHVHSAAISQLYGDAREASAQRSAYAWLLRRRGAVVMRACALVNTLGAGARLALANLSPRRRAEDRALAPWQLRRHARMHLAGLLATRRSLEQHR